MFLNNTLDTYNIVVLSALNICLMLIKFHTVQHFIELPDEAFENYLQTANLFFTYYK